MKKVAVVLNTLGCGGVAKSFIGFVDLIKDSCDLDVILFRGDGELMELLPNDVNVIIPYGYMGTFVGDRKSCKKLGFKKYIFKFLTDGVCKFTHNRKPFRKFAIKHSQKFGGYDVAISYTKACPDYDCWGGCAEFVAKNIKAKKKYIINHDDYFADNFGKSQLLTMESFDKVFFVSKSCADIVIDKVPELKEKIDYMYNPINTQEIIKMAEELLVVNLDTQKIQLVSVGRLIQQKNYLELVDIISEVKSKCENPFVLNIVGDGVDRDAIEQKIKELKLEDNVKLWGFQTNPYQIIKQADLFVLNSIWESFGIVYIEAMTLGVPVITSNVVPAQEIVGNNGFIAKNKKEMIQKLIEIINDKKRLDELKNKVSNYEFNNNEIKDKWLKYIYEDDE